MGKITGLVSLLLIGTVLAGDPQAFEDYANDMVREVEISERLALDSCLGSADVGTKVEQAYQKCFGAKYDLEDMAGEGGEDSDGDGISDDFQDMEVCFYTEMGWTDGKKVDVAAVKKDMEGMESGLKQEYDAKVDECASWSAGALRMKRDVSSQGFVSLIRSIRDANPAKGDNNKKAGKKGKKSAKKGKKGKKSAKKGKKGKKSAKKGKKSAKKGKKSAKKGKKGKKSAKKGKKSAKKGKKGKKSAKKGKKGKKSAKKGKKGKKSGKKGKKGNKKGKKSAKKGKKGKKSGKKGKKGNKKGKKGNKKGKKGNKKGNKKGKKGNKKGNKKGKKGDKKGKKSDKKGKKTVESGGVSEALYNQLWCVDLSFEQTLQKCVEGKLN